MAVPFHTPYAGTSKPFTLALHALAPELWIEVDDRLAVHLKEKDDLFANKHRLVYQAADDTLTAQSEVLDLLMAYLPEHYRDLYTRAGDTITVHPMRRTYAVADFADRPLELAARLVQDDLVLMRKKDGEAEHTLVAAALCFPSSWLLAEKFGRAMADIHEPVPGFGRGGRTAAMIERIFSNLKSDQPVERYNWSLYDTPDLYYPDRSHSKAGLFDAAGKQNIWLRVERQTLRRLPASGDVLFTIKICLDPLATLKAHPEGPRLAAALRDHIVALDPDQTAYKGITRQREAVVAELDRIVTPSP